MSATFHKRKTCGGIDAGDGRHDRCAALGENEDVVGKPRLPLGSPDPDPFSLPVDLQRLGLHEHLDPVAAVEAFRRLQEQLGALGDV